MKSTLVASVVTAGLSVFTFAANAGDHTISGGYAQSHVKFNGEKIDGNPKGKGFNLKYRYELDNNFGVISSLTYTHKGFDKSDVNYYSLMAGPTYRFNEYVSIYGMVGAARGEFEVPVLNGSYTEGKSSVSYGLGLQFNPMPNWTIDTSYEYAKFNDARLGDLKVGTWVVGVGYRF